MAIASSTTLLFVSTLLASAPVLASTPPAPGVAPVEGPALPDAPDEADAPTPPPPKSKRGLPLFGVGIGLMAGGGALATAAIVILLRNGLGRPLDETMPPPEPTIPRVLLGIAGGMEVVGAPMMIVGAARNQRANRRLAEQHGAQLRWSPCLDLGRGRASLGVRLHF